MKIYVSEKYLDLELLSKNDAIIVGSDFEILSRSPVDGGKYIVQVTTLAEVKEDTEVKTIEQHEEEIRKQVLQELKEDCGGIDYDITSKKYKLTNFDCDITKPLKQIIKEKIKDARKSLEDEIERLKKELLEYKGLGTVEELKEISEIKNQVIDQNSLDKRLKEIRSLDKDILLELCENQEIELYKLYKMLGYAKQIASAPADIVWGKILMGYLDKHKGLYKELERLKKENKQLIKDNRLLDNTKYTAQQDDIDFFVSEERLKLIAEMEDWIEKHYHWGTMALEPLEVIGFQELYQKLKEMKGVVER